MCIALISLKGNILPENCGKPWILAKNGFIENNYTQISIASSTWTTTKYCPKSVERPRTNGLSLRKYAAAPGLF